MENEPLDARNAALKAEIESSPGWAEKKAAIEKENFISADLTVGTPTADKYDMRNAEIKARFESGKGQETAPPSGDGPVDFNQARTKFGEVLGVVPGTPEFDASVRTFAAWYDDVSTNPEFDNVVRSAEKMFGTDEVLRIAHRMAGEHARKRR
jgi:hypothetical protein